MEGYLADRLLAIAKYNGWSIRYHNHPKTRARWEREPQRGNKVNQRKG